MTTRRNFLRSTALAAVATHLPLHSARALSPQAAHVGVDPLAGPDDPALRELAMRALDAARAAGARYADVRLTADRIQKVSSSGVQETARVYAGVRALADGGWGFASSGRCDGDAMARLGREAVVQAKATVWDRRGAIVLDDVPPTTSGHWTMPVGRDPFTVSPEEMRDFLHEVENAPERLALSDISVSCGFGFRRQAKLFASTAGAVQTQTCFGVRDPNLTVSWDQLNTNRSFQITTPFAAIQSGGYDCVTNAWNDAIVERMAVEVRAKATVGVVTIGKYEMVFDAATTAAIVRSIIGYATELDRVLGDDVNSDGTSYLTDASLGTSIASPVVSIVGTRSLPNGPSTVHWDDEGNTPETFNLITNGRLVDFASSRSSAPHIAAWSRSQGRAVQSRGCAAADSAADFPLVRSPDLVVQPAGRDASFDDLVADTKFGVAVLHGECNADSQQGTGEVNGDFYEIRNGRVGQYLGSQPSVLFRSAEFWKNINAVGGASSARLRGFSSGKGEPVQTATHGVVAVPLRVQNVTLLNNW